MMKDLRKFVSVFSILALLAVQVVPAGAFLPRGVTTAPPSPGFNGKNLQTNLNSIQIGGDYPFLNALKTAQSWGLSNNANAPITPDMLDSNGYLITMSGLASSGIYTSFFIPAQYERPGHWGIRFNGNGAVGSGSMSASPVRYDITNITQSGTIQTFTLASPPTDMRAGQPIAIANISGSWSGLWNSWRVLDVNVGANSFRIDTGNTYSGGLPSFTGCNAGGPCASFTSSTAVANVPGGLNGSGRYFIQPAAGGNTYTPNAQCGIISIQSSSDYPHDIQFFHADDEALLDAGEIFTTKLVTEGSSFGMFRHLNWQYGQKLNINNASSWATRKPIDYVSYDAYDLRANYYVGASVSRTGRTYVSGTPAINSSTSATYAGFTDKTTIHILVAQGAGTISGATFASGNANVTIPGHNYMVGDYLAFSGTGITLPPEINAGYYYSVVGIGTNTVQLAVFQGGSPIVPSGSSSGTIISTLGWTTYDATFAGGTTISIPNHTYTVGDQVAFYTYGGSLPSGITSGQYYYVVAAASGTIQVSATSGGSAISTGTSSGQIYSTGALLIDVGNTGTKKKIINQYGSFFQNNQWPEAGNSRSLITLVFDATLDSWLMYGGSGDWGSSGIVNGVPYEVQLALCAKIRAHCWWVTPILAADPVTDFMPSLMKYVKDNKPSWMIPRFEGPNELWNGPFPATGYATAKAAAYAAIYPAWTSSYHEWYGKALSTLGQAAATIYGIGNLGTQYGVVGGVQTGIQVTGDMGNAFPRFASNAYVTTGVAQAPLTGPWGTITFTAVPAAINSTTGGSVSYVSDLAITNYYNSNAYYVTTGTQTWTDLATAWAGSRFTATISAGTMNVSSIDEGEPLAIGRHVFGPLIPSGVTITGGSAPNWTLSDNSFSVAYSQSYTAGDDLTAPEKFADSVIDTVANGTITGGTNLTINSVISGQTIGVGLQIYGGNLPFASAVYIASMIDATHFTLTSPITNQTADFSFGQTSSLTGLSHINSSWAGWINTNFGITRLLGYEGGYSNDYVGPAGRNLLTSRSKHVAAMETYANKNYDDFRGIGATVYPPGVVGQFPSIFNMTGVYPSGNAWSVLEDIYENPQPPQWQAIKSYPFLLKRDLDPASNDNDPMWLEKAA
jgi:hypothetical protein